MTTIPLELNVCLRGALSDATATCLALARGRLSGFQVTSWRVSKLSVNMAALRGKQRAVSLARANTRRTIRGIIQVLLLPTSVKSCPVCILQHIEGLIEKSNATQANAAHQHET
jgi:hypothetical protein